jgi:hypothetical protein
MGRVRREMRQKIKNQFENIGLWLWVRVRLVRLLFVKMEVPEDARTPEQMCEEMRKRSKLT